MNNRNVPQTVRRCALPKTDIHTLTYCKHSGCSGEAELSPEGPKNKLCLCDNYMVLIGSAQCRNMIQPHPELRHHSSSLCLLSYTHVIQRIHFCGFQTLYVLVSV